MGTPLLGMNAKLYYLPTASGDRAAYPASAAGVTALNLVEITDIREVTIGMTMGEADVTTRANAGWKASVPTLNDASINFEMIKDAENTAWAFLSAAFDAGTRIGILACDAAAATTGTKGIWMDMKIEKFSEEQELEEAIRTQVMLVPAYSAVPPAYVTTGA